MALPASEIRRRKCARGNASSVAIHELETCQLCDSECLQTKRIIGVSSNPFEQEADRFAAHVMSKDTPRHWTVHLQRRVLAGKVGLGRTSANVERTHGPTGEPFSRKLRPSFESLVDHDFGNERQAHRQKRRSAYRKVHAYALFHEFVLRPGPTATWKPDEDTSYYIEQATWKAALGYADAYVALVCTLASPGKGGEVQPTNGHKDDGGPIR